jgi:integrase
VVRITLPPKGPPRDRWLTRNELAAVLWTCWRYREVQTIHRGKRKGETCETDKRPLRHLARFILLAVYTGSRAGAVLTASPFRGEGRSYVDLDRGIFYRLAEGARATNKRQPPVPLPDRLLAHLRRWASKGIVNEYFVEWHGLPVKSVKTAFKTALHLAKMTGRISPHTLRHTAATWLMHNQLEILVGPGVVAQTSRNNGLQKGAGDSGPLKRKSYFRGRPHLSRINRTDAQCMRCYRR